MTNTPSSPGGWFNQPDLGQTGQDTWDAEQVGLNQVDARLSKQYFVGDPALGTTILDALAALGAVNPATLFVPPGTHSISGDTTLTSNINLVILNGALLDIAVTKTFTINGSITAGPYQIFTGAGSVVFGTAQGLKYDIWTSGLSPAIPQAGSDPSNNDDLTRKSWVSAQIASAVQTQVYNYGVDAGSTDNYAITLVPAVTSLVAGMSITFYANTSNTGAATLKVNATAQTAIKKYVRGAKKDLQTGDIIAGQIQTVLYDGTDFVIMSTRNRGYALIGNNGTSSSPSDSTTYYFGPTSTSLVGTADVHRIYIPKAGTITKVRVTFYIAGDLGTAETSTIYLRLNNTADTQISNAVVNNALVVSVTNSALDIAVVEGDYVEFKWITPTWVTNPTGVNLSWELFIE